MTIEQALALADDIGPDLKVPKGTSLKHLLWAVRVLAGAVRRYRTITSRRFREESNSR